MASEFNSMASECIFYNLEYQNFPGKDPFTPSIYATFRFCQVSTFLILFSGFKQKEALSLSVKSSLRAYVCMHACCF
jgi:hypothetical protein